MGLEGEMVVNVITKETCRRGGGWEYFMIVQKKCKVMSSGGFPGMFGEDAEFRFIRSDAEAP
jgi:hypothetical protein